MYGKIENGQLVYAPSPLIVDEVKTWTNIASVFLSQGYKPIVNTPESVKEGYYYTSTWTETADAITQAWEEHAVELPEPSETDDMLAALNEIGVEVV